MKYQDDALNRLNDFQDGADITEAILRLRASQQEKTFHYPFPVHAFPARLQGMMAGYDRIYGASPDHYGLSMITVAGCAILKSLRLVDRGAAHPPTFYSALVAPPGVGKSPIIETIVSPVRKRAEEMLKEYIVMAKELREEHKRRKTDDELIIPAPEQPMMSSFTIEALYAALMATKDGVLIVRDEISAWLNAMDSYKQKGDEKEFFLSAHNALGHSVARKNMDIPMLIESVKICVLGGIQPGILETLTDKNSQSSGFLARILFSWPAKIEYRPYHDDVPDDDYGRRWSKIVDFLYGIAPGVIVFPPIGDLPGKTKDTPREVFLSGGAKALYAAYYDDLQQRVKGCDTEVEQSTLVKFRTHCLRIALVLHALEWATAMTEANKYEYYSLLDTVAEPVSLETMEKAIELARYFEHTGLRVVGGIDNPVEALPEDQKAWYKALPIEGSRKVAVEVGGSARLSERTVDRRLRDKDIFRYQRGKFEKLF